MSSGFPITKAFLTRGLKHKERLKRGQHARHRLHQKGAVTKRYDEVRQEFLSELDPHQHRCTRCQVPCNVWFDDFGIWRLQAGFHVHHFAKRSTHPELREDKKNLGILCASCHRAAHQQEDIA